MMQEANGKDDLMVPTVTSGALRVGDTISIPMTMSRWRRFLAWLRHPLSMPPPRVVTREFVVTSVASGTCFGVKQ